MSGLFLPLSKIALKAANTALQAANLGPAALSGYAGALSPALTSLPVVTTNVNLILAKLPPLAIGPPNLINITNCNIINSTVALTTTNIASATAQSVAAVGAPSPTFPAAAALVITNCTTLVTQIQTLLVVPQTR